MPGKNHIIILLFGMLACLHPLKGQYIPTVEEGKRWTIQLNYGLGSYQYSHFTIACDTFIQGKNYFGIYDDSLNLVGLIREDTLQQEVYFLDLDAESEDLFFKFNVNIGDTLVVNGYEDIVSDIRYDTLFGSVRKVIVFDELLAWIEGAGTSRYGIIKDYPLPNPWPTLIELQHTNESCESITSTLILTDFEVINIYPNPFTDNIQFTSQEHFNLRYKMLDICGNIVLSGNCGSDDYIETKILAPGMYVLWINGEAMKLVKQ